MHIRKRKFPENLEISFHSYVITQISKTFHSNNKHSNCVVNKHFTLMSTIVFPLSSYATTSNEISS